MNNFERQSEEVTVLESIYDEKCFIVENTNPPSGRFIANINLHHPIRIVSKSCTFKGDDASMEEEFEVNYLPPVTLFFEYPDTYPSETCPAFFLSCCWLTFDQLTLLCEHLEHLWMENYGEVVLFNWIQFLQDELLDFLHIKSRLDITELVKFNLKDYCQSLHHELSDSDRESQSFTSEDSDNEVELNNKDNKNFQNFKYIIMNIKPSVTSGSGHRDCRAFLDLADGKYLIARLKDHNELKKQEAFRNSFNLCNICFLEKKGSNFSIFKTCQHFFCNDCLKSYFEIQINEGNVHSLHCPDEKCSSIADAVLVKTIVDQDSFLKYDSLLLSRTLETMNDIAYCPRTECQCPVLIDSSERMGICPACNFVFCPFCKMAYHGVAPCNLKSEEKMRICAEYMEGDASVKAMIEKRHGKRIMQCLVENTLSEKWLNSNCKSCPHCNASIEKTEGCNKMTCFRCGIYFCWLCMQKLSATNPYSHYSEKYTDCFNRLFPEDYDAFDNFEEFDVQPGEYLPLI